MELILGCLVVAVLWVGIETHFTRKSLTRLGELMARATKSFEEE